MVVIVTTMMVMLTIKKQPKITSVGEDVEEPGLYTAVRAVRDAGNGKAVW
jgi:hypothetical protein